MQMMNLPSVLMSEKPCITPLQIPIKSWGNLVVASCLVMATLITVAYNFIHRYSYLALSKISKLALVGYKLVSAYGPLRAFFMRNISMRSHFMAKLWRDAFERAGILTSLSTNPLQLCHPHLVVNGKASNQSLGAH